MLVSIHLTTFCQAESGWLERAIGSVLAQTYVNFELICYDDGSYDGTEDILQRLAAADHRIRVVRVPENVNSVSKSLGRCFLERSPEASAITWMFDDNVLEPDALQILVDQMEQKGADVVYGQTKILTADGSHWLIGTLGPEAIAASFNETSAAVPNAGILIKPHVFDRAGWYDSSIIVRRSCDWDLFKRIWATTSDIVRVDHICATEYGELSSSSLRNSFDTSFALMKKYVTLRDEIGFRLDVLAATYGPADVIPNGPWSKDELLYIYQGFVRYYVSIGNLSKASEWSEEIIAIADMKKDLVIRNLREKFSARPEVLNAVLSGMFAQRVAPHLPALPDSVLHYGIKEQVAEYLHKKIRTAKTRPGQIYWQSAFQTARFVWRHLLR